MSKKRPRSSDLRPVSKLEPAYWVTRLFQNTFTYQGQRHAVRKWSVKIQFQGRRKTFSLQSPRRSAASLEACKIYRLLLEAGWSALAPSPATPFGERASGAGLVSPTRLQADYWRQRLVHRDYTSEFRSELAVELSVRIDHVGTSHYFPLGTSEVNRGARQALRIYRTIVGGGWETVNERFPRELTLAFHWIDHPLAWTYTTIHTRVSDLDPFAPLAGSRLTVAVVESDHGIRRALQWCLNQQPGLTCVATCASADEAWRWARDESAHLILAGQRLADQPGAVCLENLKRILPDSAGLLYSVYEDSEELFKTTPGGAGSYLLRRTRPTQILEPLAAAVSKGDFSPAEISNSAWQYFKDTCASLPPGGSRPQLAHLTQREHEVLGWLSKGHPDKEIADRLRISVWTVHGHVRKILEKLGVHNRTGAVAKYLQK